MVEIPPEDVGQHRSILVISVESRADGVSSTSALTTPAVLSVFPLTGYTTVQTVFPLFSGVRVLRTVSV